MTALVFGALLALAAPPRPAPPGGVAPPDPPCPGGVVVTQGELEAAGAMHLHDALRLAGVLDAVSVDGFDAEPLGTALPFGGRVRVLVDGAPVAGGAGVETLGLDALPVALGEVARVVVCPGGGLAAGALGGPWVDVQTAPPPRAFGAVGYGNETGDPAPLRYVPGRGAPNVDRWGPYAEGGAGARVGDAQAWAVARYRTFLPTDPAVQERTSAATSRYPKRVGTVGAVAARAPGLRVRAGARAFTDLAFAAPLAREVPFDARSAQATVAARRGGVRGWGGVARLGLGPSSRDGLGFDPAWTETRLDAALAVGGPRAEAGVRVEHVAAGAPGLTDGTVSVARAWARAARGTPRAGGVATAAAAVADGLGGGLALDGWWCGPLALRVSASARRTLADEDRDLAFWRSRGYAGFGPPLPAPPPLDIARLRVEAATGRGGVRAWASAEAVGARGAVALDRPGDPGALDDAAGLSLAGRAGASWAGRGVRVRAWAEARGAVSGTSAFREAWRRVPRVRGVADVWARPDDRLALWARLDARGGAVWAGFPEPDVPAALVLDLGVSRRFWGERLRLSLGGRNALGAEERTHPLGATLAPRLFVRAEARL